MPTYVYECRKCGHRFERFQGMKAPPVRRCPECGGVVRRLITGGAGILMKQGGTRCGSPRTCCGREERCASPPCED